MTDELKTCTKCLEHKPRSEFSTRTSKGRPYQLGQCKACERLRGTSRLREVIEDRLFETYAEDARKSPCIQCSQRPTCGEECLRFRLYIEYEAIPRISRQANLQSNTTTP